MAASTARIAWVAHNILPHEAALRHWLRRFVAAQDVEDVVQESYCNIADLAGLDHIADPKRYLFQVARNIVMADLRRARVVQFETVGGVQELVQLSGSGGGPPTPEHLAGDRALLTRIDRILASLPERARRVIQLRRIRGLSQREVARELGVSEAVVENDLSRGLRQIVSRLSENDQAELSQMTRTVRHVR